MDDLRKLQLIEIETLKEVIRICDAHDLKYFLMYGTLLGALRHNGYIPWDDDMDIAMPKEDYDRFIHYAKEELKPEFFLHDKDSDPRYFENFVRVRRNDTTIIPSAYEKANFVHNGVWVDIYPLYYAKADDTLAERIRFFLYRSVLIPFIGINAMGLNSKNLAKRFCAVFVKRMNMKTLRKWYEKIVNSCKKRNATHYICEYDDRNTRHWYHPMENFGNGRMHVFEGIQCRVPVKAEKVLEQIYGDYMQLPPEEARVGHLPSQFDLSRVKVEEE